MCESLLGQQGWIDRLRKRGYNYFVPYHDTRSRYALIASVAFWVNPGSIYICPP
jgi:hypothetical protein